MHVPTEDNPQAARLGQKKGPFLGCSPQLALNGQKNSPFPGCSPQLTLNGQKNSPFLGRSFWSLVLVPRFRPSFSSLVFAA